MNDDQLLRYARQILVPQIGIEGQQQLLDSHVVIIGLGGLGSPAALYLAAAGIGQLTLVDDDQLDLTNLQRQIAHQTKNIGKNKTLSATETLTNINPESRYNCIDRQLHGDELDALIQSADIVIDATDSFASRFEINQSCFKLKTPLVSGAAIRMEGQLSVYDFRNNDGPCYRCLYQEVETEAATCSENGILGPVVGTIGCLQAVEAIKVLTHVGNSLQGHLLIFDAFSMEWRKMKLRKDPSCPVCSSQTDAL
ncbi:MAG: molybdopterin-synthase adenylyltransferase MoeB [Gammaproteobacteria bacterium]|nr:molybdopterin-synthase adenylyltransferase MoeB [Gammaproteobacteria bacterium]